MESRGSLVLSRGPGESVYIGEGDDKIIVTVAETGYRTRLRIEAPKYVPVHRKEVYDRINKGDKEDLAK